MAVDDTVQPLRDSCTPKRKRRREAVSSFINLSILPSAHPGCISMTAKQFNVLSTKEKAK